MAYLRFSRDRRGYEQFALVQQPSNRRGSKSRPRLLYWFRSPPNIKVGREPFDPDVRRTLEVRHPDIAFDWPAIISTPIPPVETENWRERRRVERAARQSADVPEPGETPAVPEPDALPSPELRDAPSPVAVEAEPVAAALPAAQESVLADEPTIQGAPPAPSIEPAAFVPNSSAPVPGRRRRRRRRRRGGQQGDQVAAAVPVAEPPIHGLGAADSAPSDADADGEEPTPDGPDEEV